MLNVLVRRNNPRLSRRPRGLSIRSYKISVIYYCRELSDSQCPTPSLTPALCHSRWRTTYILQRIKIVIHVAHQIKRRRNKKKGNRILCHMYDYTVYNTYKADLVVSIQNERRSKKRVL